MWYFAPSSSESLSRNTWKVNTSRANFHESSTSCIVKRYRDRNMKYSLSKENCGEEICGKEKNILASEPSRFNISSD
ncbi:hypothetical protein M8J77_022909 [Diaphorina citri]|nr:hypothetical protein M8J77_022909 [Diaphorina citri]